MHYQDSIMIKINKYEASNEVTSILAGLCSEILFTMNKSSDSKNFSVQ